MLFEFLVRIDWVGWLERFLCAVGILLVAVIFIWTIPIFFNWALALASVHAKIRQGIILLMRIAFSTASVFVIADVLGFDSNTVVAMLVAVFGVGISWAVKDNVSNALSGLMLFLFQSFTIGDTISAVNGNFSGMIQAFHLQYTLIENDKGEIFYVPNALLWTTVIKIRHSQEHHHPSSMTNWIVGDASPDIITESPKPRQGLRF